MMKKFNIEIYTPTVALFFHNEDKIAKFYMEFINEIILMSEKLKLKFLGVEYPVKIEIICKNHENQINNKIIFNKIKKHIKDSDILRFNVLLTLSLEQIECCFTDVEGRKINIPDKQKLSIHADFAAHYFYKLIIDLIICGNIAKPHSIEIRESIIFINRKYIFTKEAFLNEFWIVDDYLLNLKKPYLKNLSTIEVFEWINKIPGFDNAASQSSLGRAIGAFSYLFKSDRAVGSRIDFVWILIALEALYCKKNRERKNQLIKKILRFLEISHKENEAISNAISKMYEIRSGLIHGKMNFVFKHNQADSSKECEKFDDTLYNIESYSLAILFSTLQKMVTNNLYKL